MIHASAVAGDRGIAFAGASGVGKSTMALALIDRGYRFVTNDRLLVRAWGDRVDMVGLPKMPRVNPGTVLRLPRLSGLVADRSRYDAMDRRDLWALEEKRDVRIPEVFGSDPQPQGALDEVYVLGWTLGGGGPRMRRLAGFELAAHLWEVVRSTGVFDLRAEPRAAWNQALAMAASRVRGFEVRGGVDVAWLADAVERATERV
jgi:HprK-related kinase B